MKRAHTGSDRGVGLLRGFLRRRVVAVLRNARPRGALRSLSGLAHALDVGDLDTALRDVDRAWRCEPDYAAGLAPLYGALLLLEARDLDAALGMLQRAGELAPDAEVLCLGVLALLQLQRPEDARRQLSHALSQFCVLPGGMLAQVAGAVMRDPASAAPGWVGRGPALELTGEFTTSPGPKALALRSDGVWIEPLRPRLRRGADVRSVGFTLATERGVAAHIELTLDGQPLLGSGQRPPPDFALDGRADVMGRRVSGWARLGWEPTRPLALAIEDETGRRAPIRSRRISPGEGRRPFAVDLRAAGLQGRELRILTQLPDGRWQPLPDATLLLPGAVRLPGRTPQLTRWRAARPRPRRASAAARPRTGTRTCVLIPVFRGRTETLACLDAVRATVGRTTPVIVIDDATADVELAAALDARAAAGQITLLRNARNLGFVQSANRGLALQPDADAVLLNSDTLVFGDWLARLRRAAYSAPRVGTVTPWSNSGSICSYPHAQGAPLDAPEAAALDALAAATHTGIRAPLPVGVGFCLYLRRDCLRDTGTLDARVFGAGYGEESDFCLRAHRRGWSHVLAADVFVYHAGGLSFGARRTALLERSQRLLNLRHPGYDAYIADFLAQDPLQPLRRQLDERRLALFKGRWVLLVTLALAGGVDRFVAQRCRDLRAQGLFPLVLRPAAAGDARRCELWTDALVAPNLRYEVPKDLPALTALLARLDLAACEIQHFLHLDARLIEAVRALPGPYDVFIHDYAWICPRVTLIDGSGRYCHEPPVEVCGGCLRRNGSTLGESITVPALRARSDTWLRGARHVIAPSADAAARLRRHFAGLNLRVQPHAPPVAVPPVAPVASALPAQYSRGTRQPPRTRVRVALLGGIGVHKGYEVLLACARDARSRRLPLEFVVIGYTQEDGPLLATGRVFVTGRYTEAEVPHLLRREQPDVLFLPSVWPETWCYALDHALASGLPVAAFDLGAIAARLRAAGHGALWPLDLDAPALNGRLIELAQSQTLQSSPAVADRMLATRSDGTRMKARKASEPAPAAASEGLSASVQVLPLPAGLYLFAVKSDAATPAARGSGPLALPALHVAVGPGVRAEQVEFMSGAATQGAWLFAPGDLLVARVSSSGATLVLTSVRGQGGESLSIKVERLDSRSTTPPAAVAAAAPGKSAASPTATPAGDASQVVAVHISAHIRSRGDMNFGDAPWAGRVARGLWIESFALQPQQRFGPDALEYKGLTGSGFETPWISDGKTCGTRGMAVPLVGFAVRLKPGAATAAYDCEYSGCFQSGLIVGPLLNGAPCSSSVANDPLEGIQVRLIRRAVAPVRAPTKSAPRKLAGAPPGRRRPSAERRRPSRRP